MYELTRQAIECYRTAIGALGLGLFRSLRGVCDPLAPWGHFVPWDHFFHGTTLFLGTTLL